MLKFPEKPWNWNNLSRNKSITFQDVLEHPEKPWDWSTLCGNKSIDFQDVLKHLDKPWNWDLLGNTIFKVTTFDPDYIQLARRYIAVNKIKKMWFRCITDPEYIMCKKRLMKEFNEI